MVNTKKVKLIIMIVMAVSTFLTAVVATYTWYMNQNLVDTTNTPVQSSTTPSLFAGFPEGELNTEKYYGQTGIQYNGEDYPYILNYSPITIKPMGLDDKLRYLTAGIEGMKVILSGKDEFGHPIEEEYLLTTDIGAEMLSHFTFRMNLIYYNNGSSDIQTNQSYKNENGFIVNEITEQPLLLVANYTYYFGLQIIFQSEEGYYNLEKYGVDLDSSFIFPLSNQKYMFSNIKISFDFGLNELMKVNLNANGGTCSTAYLPTTGNGNLTLPTTAEDISRQNYTFGGWYYEADCIHEFKNDSLKTTPIGNDITVYAKWTAMPKVTLNYNLSGYTPATQDYYIVKGTKFTEPTDPVYGGYMFVGWSENINANYANFEENEYNFDTVVNADKVLYAVWRKQYTVTLHITEAGVPALNGKLTQYVNGVGTVVSTDVYSFNLYEGETIGSYFDNTKDIYYKIESTEIGDKHFMHWSTTVSKQGVTYNDAPAYNMSQPQNSSVTLYAFYFRLFG